VSGVIVDRFDRRSDHRRRGALRGAPQACREKPTVATVGTVGASAAYMAAIATDHIVARRTSITGSIGVIFQYPEVSELLDKLGVRSRRSRARR
jgi:ClpP class serine protease